MPIWEVVDGNRRLVREFSSEEEAYQWVEQQNAQSTHAEGAVFGLKSLDNAENILRVAILGF